MLGDNPVLVGDNLALLIKFSLDACQIQLRKEARFGVIIVTNYGILETNARNYTENHWKRKMVETCSNRHKAYKQLLKTHQVSAKA